jgi:SYP5 family syntaxin
MAEGDGWQEEVEGAQEAAREVRLALEERAEAVKQGRDAAKHIASARRKLNGLAARLDRLDELAHMREEPERSKRSDASAKLREQHRKLEHWLSRGAGNAASGAQETEDTAPRDAQGLLQLQRDTLSDQDRELDDLMSATSSTKHVALAINEELGLHHRLLDDLNDDLCSTQSRLRRAAQAAKRTLTKRSTCRAILCASALIVVLVVVLVLSLHF